MALKLDFTTDHGLEVKGGYARAGNFQNETAKHLVFFAVRFYASLEAAQQGKLPAKVMEFHKIIIPGTKAVPQSDTIIAAPIIVQANKVRTVPLAFQQDTSPSAPSQAAQAYAYLKTLPEFAVAEDVHE